MVGGGGSDGGRGWVSGRIVAGCEVGEAEPVQDVGGVFGNGVADTLGEDSLDVRAEGGAGVACLWVVGRVGDGGLGDTEDIRPLLNVLPEVLRVERVVSL